MNLSNENNYLVSDKIEKNTTYEIRICSIYKDIISNWSDIHKIKTKNLDCLILNGLEKENEYLQKLYEWTGYKGMELIYRGTRDVQIVILSIINVIIKDLR